MTTNSSELLFEKYLVHHQIAFEREYPSGSKNLDFRMQIHSKQVLADVKHIEDRLVKNALVEAHLQLRNDIKSLRAKFDDKPKESVLLISVSWMSESRVFTGFTVARALYGDVGRETSGAPELGTVVSEVKRLKNGRAAFTSKQNTSISGVLIYQGIGKKGYLFINPFARIAFDENLPDVESICLDDWNDANRRKALSSLMFSSMINHEI